MITQNSLQKHVSNSVSSEQYGYTWVIEMGGEKSTLTFMQKKVRACVFIAVKDTEKMFQMYFLAFFIQENLSFLQYSNHLIIDNSLCTVANGIENKYAVRLVKSFFG